MGYVSVPLTRTDWEEGVQQDGAIFTFFFRCCCRNRFLPAALLQRMVFAAALLRLVTIGEVEREACAHVNPLCEKPNASLGTFGLA